MVTGLSIQQCGHRPAPRIGLVVEVCRGPVSEHVLERFFTSGGYGVGNHSCPSPHGNLFFIKREKSRFEPAVFIAMGTKKLGHAFHIPRRPAPAQKHVHKGVRSLVQQQMPSVIAARLLVQPEPVVLRIPVAKRRVADGHKAQPLERLSVFHQKTGDVPIGVLGRIEPEIFAPLRQRLVENGRQLVDRAARWQIGIKRDMLAREPSQPRPA